jgi:TRAP-type C4-dicarboxylate transport system permease small subunit
METLAKLTRMLSQLTLAFAASGLVAMTAIIGWQVFGRFVLNESPAWSEQAALVLMVWYVSIAAAVGVREGFHIRLVALVDSLSAPVQRVVEILAHFVVLCFGATLAVYGADLVARTWDHAIPTLPIGRGFTYMPLPIAGAMIVLFSAEHILARALKREVLPLWN